MNTRRKPWSQRLLAILAAVPAVIGLSLHAQSTTPGVTIDVLGTGTGALLLSPLTDPENDGLDALGGATDPSWNWKNITSSVESDFEGGENSFNIFDHKVGGGNDKWCCDDPTPDVPVWVDVEFAKSVSLTHFTVASGNDSPDRDPVDWAIQGSNDGTTYTDIYHFIDTPAPWTDRNQVLKFTLPSKSAPYTHIRYIAYDTPGSLHQLNEIEYFGGPGVAPVDTDNDGMPDDYEIANGFNPNDKTDAAKDFDKDGATNLAEYLAGTNPTNTIAPVLISATASASFNQVVLVFDDLENLEEVSATNTANYAFSPALNVLGATLKKKTVTLTTAAQTPGATQYTVTVTGVKDLSKNAVGTQNKAVFYSYLLTRTGVLKFSYWAGINGTAVQNLLDDPRYPATPDSIAAVHSFSSRDAFPDDSHENYGATVEGFLTPTESASYRFFVYSDDSSALFLSPDDKEAGLAQIAEETGCCNNFTEPDSPRTSEPVALLAGKKYFVRLIYKEGGGGDYGQVAWRKEGDLTPAGSLQPIPGAFLSAATDLPVPPEGTFTTRIPAAAAKGVSPNTKIQIAHRDGKTIWTAANVSLKLDGVVVPAVITKVNDILNISYTPPAFLPSLSSHTVTLSYLDAGGLAATSTTTFGVAVWAGPTKDKVAGYPGLILGSAKYTADTGGHTAKAGDYAVDLTLKGGPVVTYAPAFLAAANAATASDEVTVAFWQKKEDTLDSSAFALSSPTAGNNRVFHAHVPWSNQNIYFDTAGCCDATTQRISADIATFADYVGSSTDNSWWTNQWHFFVFTKKGTAKNIWIDGKLFLSGDNTGPMQTDVDAFYISAGGNGADAGHAVIDDFSVYGKELILKT